LLLHELSLHVGTEQQILHYQFAINIFLKNNADENQLYLSFIGTKAGLLIKIRSIQEAFGGCCLLLKRGSQEKATT